MSLENDLRQVAAKEWHQRGKYLEEKRLRLDAGLAVDRADLDRKEKHLYRVRIDEAKTAGELVRIINALAQERPDTTRPAVIAWLEKEKKKKQLVEYGF